MPRRNSPEYELHKAVIEWLGWAKPDCVYFHPYNGAYMSKATAGKGKALGVLPGVADLVFGYRSCAASMRSAGRISDNCRLRKRCLRRSTWRRSPRLRFLAASYSRTASENVAVSRLPVTLSFWTPRANSYQASAAPFRLFAVVRSSCSCPLIRPRAMKKRFPLRLLGG